MGIGYLFFPAAFRAALPVDLSLGLATFPINLASARLAVS